MKVWIKSFNLGYWESKSEWRNLKGVLGFDWDNKKRIWFSLIENLIHQHWTTQFSNHLVVLLRSSINTLCERQRQTNYLQIYSEEFFRTAGKTYCFVLTVTGLSWIKPPAQSTFYLTLILSAIPVVADILKGKVLEQQQFHNDLIPSKYLQKMDGYH